MKNLKFQICKKPPSIGIPTQLLVLHVSVQAVTRLQTLTGHLHNVLSFLNHTTNVEEMCRKMNMWRKKSWPNDGRVST